MQTSENQAQYKWLAAIITLLFHGLLFLFFLFMVFKTPNPPYPESPAPGIEINFGNLVEGTGNVENDQMGEASNRTPSPAVTNPNSSPNNVKAEKVVTSDDEESVSINQKKETKEQTKKEPRQTEIEITKPQPVASSELMNALNQFRNRSKNSGGGDGNSGKPGNEGSPDGNPLTDGKGGGGSGSNVGVGRGIRYDLKGRSLIKRPTIIDDSQDQGKVVVEIVVNSAGDVIHAEPGARGSTTSSPILYAKARQAAYSAKFNTNIEGANEQRGSMTFVFVLD